MSRKKKQKKESKPEQNLSLFSKLPCDIIRNVLSYDARFYYTSDGKLISRFTVQDYRYGILLKIPKINYIWNCYYTNNNVIMYIVSVVFVSKNRKQRYTLSYYHHENLENRKVVFRNPYYQENICYI